MTCNEVLRREGKRYPRTCAECRLGPCTYKPEVKIKPLVWESTKLMRGGESADCPMGEFRIAKYGHVVGVDFCVYLNGLFRKKCSSLKEAKAWAQQEYERRVMECLE